MRHFLVELQRRARAARSRTADGTENEENLISRRLDGSGLHHHLDLVFGPREQLDGSGLAEPGSVHLVEDGTLVGLDPERDGDVDDVRDAVHVAALSSRKREGGCAVLMRRGQAAPRDRDGHFRDAPGSEPFKHQYEQDVE